MAPWVQVSPRWRSGAAVDVAHCCEQAEMPDWTPVGFVNTLWRMAVAGRPTLTRPTSFCRAVAPGFPTVDSAKATEFDVPSRTALMALDCWNANRPVVGTFASDGA